MIEQMKNINEYRKDGNLYVKKIKSCNCQLKIGDKYIITCNIHQRGKHEYVFSDTDKWISRGDERKLWLSDDADKTVRLAVNLFEEQVKYFQTDVCREIRMEDANLSIFYKIFSEDKFDCMVKYFGLCSNNIITELYTNTTIYGFLHNLRFSSDLRHNLPNCESKELLQNPTKENIMNNPFVVAAQEDGDVTLEKKIKMFYGLADENDCNQLTELLGMRVLPPLPNEYNQEYYIDIDTITRESYALLSRSGFEFLHRPYFAMKGSTHTKITVNPHTKKCVDAAKTDTESLSFEEFLKIYDKYEYGRK